MFEINWIRECVKDKHYYLSKHADQERQGDNLVLREIEEALFNGIILDRYNDTGRGKSCLVAGYSKAGKPLHIVCGLRQDWLVIVTVYIPQPPKFKTLYERGVK